MSEICVSVITPTHNMAEFLPETVRSVREQTLSGVEHIVIDDGSTDNTPEIAASFGPDVTFTRVPHGGAARARNIGLSMARGATVMFLDADDVIAPDTLRLLHAALGDARDCIAYGTQFDLLFRDGAWKPGDAPRPFHPPDGDPLRSLLLRQWSVLPCGELWPRSLVDRLGGFDERCAALQDADLLFRALASGVRLLPVPGAVSHYRRHEGARTPASASRTTAPKSSSPESMLSASSRRR